LETPLKIGKFLFLLILTILYPAVLYADWINLTGAENSRNIAERYVEKDHVRIKLEVYVQDIIIFEELIPDEFFPEPIPGRPGPDERIRIFADQTFQVITDTGEKLAAKLDLVEPRKRIERPSPFVGAINPYTRRIESLLAVAVVCVFGSTWIDKGMGLIVGGFIPNPFEHITEYAPTLPELGISFGIWAMGLFIVTILYKIAIEVREEMGDPAPH